MTYIQGHGVDKGGGVRHQELDLSARLGHFPG